MAQQHAQDGPNTLAEARVTIARQAEELERLRQQLADDRLGEKVKQAVATARLAQTVSGSVSHTAPA
jgi:hypothetical protein